MKLILTIIILVFTKLTIAQCLIPLHSREHKKIKIGEDPLKIFSESNQVSKYISEYDYYDSQVNLSNLDKTKIASQVNAYLESNKINHTRFKYKDESLFKLNKDSIKVYCPILEKFLTTDFGFYCEGEIYLEKNVSIRLPLILDKSFNIEFGDCSTISKIPENTISICKAYSQLINLDKKIGLLDVVEISIEVASNHTNLIFEVTDYRLTGLTNNSEHHYTNYYYQVNMLTGNVFIRASEALMEYSCG